MAERIVFFIIYPFLKVIFDPAWFLFAAHLGLWSFVVAWSAGYLP